MKLAATYKEYLYNISYFFVANVFESVGDDGDAHVDQVGGGHLEDLLGELLAILVDFLKEKEKVVKMRADAQIRHNWGR